MGSLTMIQRRNTTIIILCLGCVLVWIYCASLPVTGPNSCPTNPYTGVQWIYDAGTCRYPRFIPGRGDTGQQTDIEMSAEAANAYVASVGDPRALFLNPARLLNNRSVTNMSDEALAARVYAQVYVEEKWFKDYNWVHPYWNSSRDPQGGNWLSPTSLNAKRYAPFFLGSLNDWAITLTADFTPYRLGGFGFGPGNELFGQAWDSSAWFLDYLNLPDNRYGLRPTPLTDSVLVNRTPEAVRNALLSLEPSQFWNTLRFLWAAARHREGAYPDSRPAPESARRAIDYRQLVGKPPSGRPQSEVSAFALITTVYTDAITVPEVTGYGQAYRARANRDLEAWKRFISERNKAIRDVELLGNASLEGRYRIQQALAIGPLVTQYASAANADFLPYSREEVDDLVHALLAESNNRDDPWVAEQALQLLDDSPLLHDGYRYYFGKALKIVAVQVDDQPRYVLEQ